MQYRRMLVTDVDERLANMRELDYSRIESINRIISGLYSSYDLPIYNRIINFFAALLEEIYFDKATMLFFFKNEDGFYQKKSSITLNWNEETLKSYSEYFSRIDDVLPVLDQASPIVFKSSDFFNRQERENTEYYKEYLKPNNIHNTMEANVFLPKEPGLRAEFALSRGKDKSDFTEQDVQIVKLLQPHLSNVFTYYENEASGFGLEGFLENYNSVGIGMLNSKYEIIKCNNVFRKFNIDSGNGYATTAVYGKIVELCRSLSRNDSSANSVSAEYKFDSEPLFIEVSVNTSNDQQINNEFCCLVYDLTHFYRHTLHKVEKQYGLTAREMDILKSILKGCSNEYIAKEYYLSLPTVKRYIATLYEKLGINSYKQIFEKLKMIE